MTVHIHNKTKHISRYAFPIFSLAAAWMSWVVNKSIGWALVHFFCGFFYVLYCTCAHNEEVTNAIANVGH